MTEQTVEEFIALFQGRTDAYGAWEGYQTKIEPRFGHLAMRNHLHDGPYIGVYCITPDNHTRWGCIDLDGKDFPVTSIDNDGRAGASATDWDRMWTLAALLQDVLAYKDITSWLERTKNGIHVWVFVDEPVLAATMRHALLVACEVADYKPKEVNPKQTELTEAKPYGNFVRLPYYGALANGTPPDRFVVDEDGMPLTVEGFCRSAIGSRNPVALLESLAELYEPPVPLQVNVELSEATAAQFAILEPILPPLVKVIFEEGPLNGDRSGALVKTAILLRNDGWRAQAAFTVLMALDERLGKFVGRPDREEKLLEIIEKVELK